MNNQPFIISRLIIKKFRSELTEQESQILTNWLAENPKNEELMHSLLDKAATQSNLSIFDSFDEEEAYQKISRKKTKKPFSFVWYAAAILIASITISAIFFFNEPQETKTRFAAIENQKHKNDVLPAEVGAYIIKNDGEQIQVDGNILINDSGLIVTEDGMSLINEIENVSTENTLVVPAAHFFALTLSDGSKVWVNANSELSFPSKFSNLERKVKIKGEAYFEVAKDPNRPFIVESNGAKIQVLGTHFNVNSYSKKTKATLVEGKISISNNSENKILLPGQQAIVSENRLDVGVANIDRDLAWKNNIFRFKSDNIISIAHQLKDWYDLQISFSKEVSFTQKYTGEIRRDAKLSEVLNMLEYVSNLDFRIEENKLLILNKE